MRHVSIVSQKFLLSTLGWTKKLGHGAKKEASLLLQHGLLNTQYTRNWLFRPIWGNGIVSETAKSILIRYTDYITANVKQSFTTAKVIHIVWMSLQLLTDLPWPQTLGKCVKNHCGNANEARARRVWTPAKLEIMHDQVDQDSLSLRGSCGKNKFCS